MTFRMIVQLWNTNTSAFVSCEADLTENYMYISMKFGTGVHVFCWEVGVFNRSSFQSLSYNHKRHICGFLYSQNYCTGEYRKNKTLRNKRWFTVPLVVD